MNRKARNRAVQRVTALTLILLTTLSPNPLNNALSTLLSQLGIDHTPPYSEVYAAETSFSNYESVRGISPTGSNLVAQAVRLSLVRGENHPNSGVVISTVNVASSAEVGRYEEIWGIPKGSVSTGKENPDNGNHTISPSGDSIQWYDACKLEYLRKGPAAAISMVEDNHNDDFSPYFFDANHPLDYRFVKSGG